MDELDYEKDLEFIENDISVSPFIKEFAQNSKNVIKGNPLEKGSGELLALKLILQSIGKCLIVGSGKISLLCKYPSNYLDCSFINAQNPCAVAIGLSKSKENVLVYADDVTTLSNFQTLKKSFENDENFIYVCYNTKRYKNHKIKKSFFYKFKKAKYCASASISHPEDFIKKMKEIESIEGFRFIEVLTPSPIEWDFDNSNTIEIARLCVDSKLWPLVKSNKKKKLETSLKIDKLENIENLLFAQKRINTEKEELKNIIKNNWVLIKDPV